MKTYLEFVNEAFGGLKLNLEGLAEMAARTQDPSSKQVAEKVFLDILKKDQEVGYFKVLRRFKKMTDLQIKFLPGEKDDDGGPMYQIIYDDYY